jgi:transposase-like protein
MYFSMKNTLKNNHNHAPKQALISRSIYQYRCLYKYRIIHDFMFSNFITSFQWRYLVMSFRFVWSCLTLYIYIEVGYL